MFRRIREHPTIAPLFEDGIKRVHATSMVTAVFDVGYGALTILSGIAYGSWWSLSVGVYYVAMLALALLFVLGIGVTSRIGDDWERASKELAVYRDAGWALLAFNVALTGVAVQMIRYGMSWTYPPFIIYGVAAFAFGNLVVAIVGIVREGREGSYIAQAIRSVNLAKAVVGIFFLTTALIVEFGNDDAFRLGMESGVGAVCMVFVIIVALRMLVYAHHERKKLDALRASRPLRR